MIRRLILISSFLLVTTLASAQSLEGVWSVVEADVASGENAGSQQWPGMIVFTGGHIAFSLVTTDQPRREFSESSTDTDRSTVWGAFNAGIGTYEYDGANIMGSWLLNKNPSDMGPDSSFTWPVDELTENTFAFTTGGTRYSFIRLE